MASFDTSTGAAWFLVVFTLSGVVVSTYTALRSGLTARKLSLLFKASSLFGWFLFYVAVIGGWFSGSFMRDFSRSLVAYLVVVAFVQSWAIARSER